MEFDFQSHDNEDERYLYECVIEEIALEGLDGITLQGLWARLIDREGAPISQYESRQVKSSIWNAMTRDPRLSMYVLPEPRAPLQIYNRMLKTDFKGNIEEPEDTPDDIYPYNLVEISHKKSQDTIISHKKLKKKASPLPSHIYKSIDLNSTKKSKVEMEIEGIRFHRPVPKTSTSGESKKKRERSQSGTRKSQKADSKIADSKISGRKSRTSKTEEKSKTSKTQEKSKTSKKGLPKRGKTTEPISKLSKPDLKKPSRSKTVEPQTQKGTNTNSGTPSMAKRKIPEVDVKNLRGIRNSKRGKALLVEKPKMAETVAIPIPNSKKATGKAISIKIQNSKAEDNKKGKKSNVAAKGEPEIEEKSKLRLMAIRGSCPHFHTRKNITKKIRKTTMNYSGAEKLFGHQMVIVAGQFLREYMLFVRNNQVRISPQQYCMIERIGRARHYGEQARGKISLTCMKIDAKTQFYHRKVLLADRLIAKQGFIMRFPETRTGTLISVFHLPYFYRRLESTESVNIRKIFFRLHASPNYILEYYRVQNSFGKHLMRVLNDTYRDFIEVEEESYAVIHPEEYENEKKVSRKENLSKRRVKVIRLKEPETAIRKLVKKQLMVSQEADDTIPENQLQDGDDPDEDEFDWDFCHSKESELAHELEATHLIKFVISRGNKGFLLEDILEYMNVNHLDARSASRYLVRWKIVRSFAEERNKIKITRFIFMDCKGSKEQIISTDEENEAGPKIDVEATVDSLFNEPKLSVAKQLPSTSANVSDIDSQSLEASSAIDIASKTPKSPSKISRAKNNSDSQPANKGVKKIKDSKEVPELQSQNPNEKATPKADPKMRAPRPKAPKKAYPLLMSPTFPVITLSPSKDTDSIVDTLAMDSSNPIGSAQSGTSISSSQEYFPALLPYPNPRPPPKPRVKVKEASKETLLNKVQIGPDGKMVPKRTKTRRPRNPSRPMFDANGKRLSRNERMYDDIDRLALSYLRKQRAEWSGKEDRAILYLFIASVLFIPRYNMNRIFIFNSTQIRDILYTVVEESKTKTSIAVRRRIHFLMKNRIFFSEYRNLLNNALRDEYLYRTLIARHLPQPSINIYHPFPLEALRKVYEYLCVKFSEKEELEFDTIRSRATIDDILVLRELQRMESIWMDIWGTLFIKEDEPDSILAGGTCSDNKRKLPTSFDNENENKRPAKIQRLAKEDKDVTSKNKSRAKRPASEPDVVLEPILPHEVRTPTTGCLGPPQMSLASDKSNTIKLTKAEEISLDGSEVTESKHKSRRSSSSKSKRHKKARRSSTEKADSKLKSRESSSEKKEPLVSILPSADENDMSIDIASSEPNIESDKLKSTKRARLSSGESKSCRSRHRSKHRSDSKKVSSKADCTEPDKVKRHKKKHKKSKHKSRSNEATCVTADPSCPILRNQDGETAPNDVVLPQESIESEKVKRSKKKSRRHKSRSKKSCSAATDNPSCPVSKDNLVLVNTGSSSNIEPEKVKRSQKSKDAKVEQSKEESTAAEDITLLNWEYLSHGKDWPPSKEYTDEELHYAFQIAKYLIENMAASGSSGDDDDDISTPGNRGKDAKTHKKIQLFVKETQDDKPDIVGSMRDAEDRNDIQIWTARTNLLCMVFSGELLTTVRKFMSNVSDPNLLNVIASLRKLGILSITKAANKFSLSMQIKRLLVSYMSPLAFRQASYLLNALSDRDMTLLRNYKYMGMVHLLTEISLTLKVKIVLPDCIISVHEGWKKDYQALLNNSTSIESEDKENYALRLLRLRLNKDTMTGKYVEKDFFDINLPQVYVRHRKSAKLDRIIADDPNYQHDNIKIYLENSLIKLVEYDEKADRYGASKEDKPLPVHEWLYKIIESTETVGLSLHYLIGKFGAKAIRKGLEYLLESNFVYMIGIRNRKLVAGPFMEHWTTAVPNKTDGRMTKRVIMRVWMNAVGEMNWKILDRFLIAVIGCLQNEPVLFVAELCQILRPVLSDLETLMIITTLLRLNIIDAYKLKEVSKRRKLFQELKLRKAVVGENFEYPYKDYNVDTFLDLENLCIELLPFHVLKYAHIQETIVPRRKKSKVDEPIPMPVIIEEAEDVVVKYEGVPFPPECTLGLVQDLPIVTTIFRSPEMQDSQLLPEDCSMNDTNPEEQDSAIL